MNGLNKSNCNSASRVICETGVEGKLLFLHIIYDKPIAFICEKIQYCFSCNSICTLVFFSSLFFLKNQNLIRITPFSRNPEILLNKPR